METDPFGMEPMFEVPPKYQPPKREQKWPVWKAYRGGRMSCDDCLIDIANGDRKFMSELAHNVRQDANGTRYYCPRHTRIRKEQEGRR